LRINAGRIEEGRLADLFLIDIKAPNMIPFNPSNLVYSSNPSNISEVIIDGKLVMEEGRVVSLDEEKVLEKAQRVAERFILG